MKDAIRRRGENISSFEVEAEALCHPAVLEAAAIPVPSTESEDEVLLVVTASAGQVSNRAPCCASSSRAWRISCCRATSGSSPEMPKTPTAKIEKHRLRAEGVTADTWDREAHGVTVRGGQVAGLESD